MFGARPNCDIERINNTIRKGIYAKEEGGIDLR